MHLLLLRSLLREMITDLAGPSSTGDEPNREGMTRYLIVVARTEPAVYEHLRNRHVGDPKVKVVLDRRGAPDAESMDGAPPADRRHRRSSLTAGALQTELDALRGERATVAQAFGGVVDLLGQLHQPLSDIARRLQTAQPTVATHQG